MEKYTSLLTQVQLFRGIREKDISYMLSCLNARIGDYGKGEFIFIVGDKIENIGVVLSGNLHIIKETFEGDRVIIDTLYQGDYFAETLCCANIKFSPISVVANKDAKILLLDFFHVLRTCSSSCSFHTKLIENMMHIIAQKNIILQNRLDIISQRTLRQKVLNYLQSLAISQGKNIIIPFNREEFADFLCVDRSSLSHELSRMKRDGLIDYHRNHFKLL